jgi:hypothetical protein
MRFAVIPVNVCPMVAEATKSLMDCMPSRLTARPKRLSTLVISCGSAELKGEVRRFYGVRPDQQCEGKIYRLAQLTV